MALESLIKLPHSAEERRLVKLVQYDLIEVKGKDACEFLNNQFTNDLKILSENESSLSAWCSIKGRVLYTFRIWFYNKTFQLLLPSIQTESFLKKLKMYIFRSEVTIEQIHDKYIYGLSGKDSGKLLEYAPENDNAFVNNEDELIIKIPACISRYLIISKNKNLKIESFSVKSRSDNYWKLLDIHAGIPEILPNTADMFLPQMLNLENLGGLSFQKGCYPGQEIVARVKYRGELKKQLYKASVTTELPIEAGSPLVTSSNHDSAIGHVINAENLNKNTLILLTVINIATLLNDDICLQNDKGAKLKIYP